MIIQVCVHFQTQTDDDCSSVNSYTSKKNTSASTDVIDA